MEKQCFICNQPLHKIKIGSSRLPYMVHRGAELKLCQAIHPMPASIAIVRKSVEHMAEKRELFKVYLREDQQPLVHGEHVI
jgi:hypothetical protein